MLSSYEQITILLNKASHLALKNYTEGGNREWTQREEFLNRLDELVGEFWDYYRRTPDELKEHEKALRQW